MAGKRPDGRGLKSWMEDCSGSLRNIVFGREYVNGRVFERELRVGLSYGFQHRYERFLIVARSLILRRWLRFRCA